MLFRSNDTATTEIYTVMNTLSLHDAPDLAAVMVMHTEVADVDDAVDAVFRHWDGPVGVYPHVGGFAPPSWQFDERFTPADLVANARRWVDRGVRIVGGCCGLGPSYIEALAAEFGEP